MARGMISGTAMLWRRTGATAANSPHIPDGWAQSRGSDRLAMSACARALVLLASSHEMGAEGTSLWVRVLALRAKRQRRALRLLGGLIVAVCSALCCLGLGVPAVAMAAAPPSEVQTEPASQTSDGFVLRGELNPEGSATIYYFIYKKIGEAECEDLEGCGLETAHGAPLSGDGEQEVPPAEVTDLAPGTTYVYWLIAKNSNGTTRGRELTFTTPVGAPPSEVVTGMAEATASGFKLNGKLNPNDLPTTYYFEYIGENEINCVEVENCRPQTAHMGPIDGDSQEAVSPVEVTGLRVGETYRYWLVASNADRTVRSSEASFTVPATGGPSEVQTEPAESTANGFKLAGELNPEGLPTSYYFAYDTGFECGEAESCALQTTVMGPLVGDTRQQAPPIEVIGLVPDQTYRFWLIAENADGAVRGRPLTFVTPSHGDGDGGAGGESLTGDAESVALPLLASPPVATPKIATRAAEPPRRSQEFAKALKICERKRARWRAACRREARVRYRMAITRAARRANRE
jgi:hypothetical protein